jgi:hypothetical protein
MKKSIALISAFAVLLSGSLALGKDAPKKQENGKNGWYENLGRFLKGLQEAGKKAGDFIASFTDNGKAEKDVKKKADKAGSDADKAAKKAGKDLKKSGKKVSNSLQQAGKDLKKAVKKAGNNLSR